MSRNWLIPGRIQAEPGPEEGDGLREPRHSPRHLLILLGMICQGMSFDGPWVALLYAGLWYIGTHFGQIPGRRTARRVEAFLLLLAISAAYVVGGDYGYNRLVFIGNALVLFQFLLLVRPLSAKEKVSSIIIALVHLGVGSQVIANYAFSLVFLTSAVLIPGALARLHDECSGTGPEYPKSRSRLGIRRPLAIAVLACVFFILCPRLQLLPAGGSTTGLVRSQDAEELELSDGGGNSADALLFRITGEGVRYLKRTALDEWDGRRWQRSMRMVANRAWYGNIPGGEPRRRYVTLMDVQRLGHTIPVDGYVTSLEGDFFQRPYLAEEGSVRLPIAIRRNVSYTYYSVERNPSDRLSERLRTHYLALPPQTPALREWLDRVLRGTRSDLEIVQRLAQYFQDNFTYELGAPRLNEEVPVEDFIFRERRGHCARYAAVTAILLRMKGIPSRVGLGWAPTERNEIGGFYNVRSRHAHAWAEAWLEGQGWTVCDGTPYGAAYSTEDRPLRLTLSEWIEFLWYSRIVEFDSREESVVSRILGPGVQNLFHAGGKTGSILKPGLIGMLFLAIVTVLIVLLARQRVKRSRQSRRNPGGPGTDHDADSFYGRMLEIVRHKGYVRRATVTPAEFAAELKHRHFPGTAEAETVTEAFIRTRYGLKNFSPELRERVQEALIALRHRSKHRSDQEL